QVVSIMTATGFSSANFNTWTPFVHFLLLTLMFIGGCTGSTAGGLKVSRIALLSKVIGRELRHSARPRAVVPVRLNGQAVQDRAVQPVLAFVCLAILTNLAASALLCATGLDIISAVSGVTSCMFNVGPGLGSVGPASNYGHLTMLAKWVLIFTMIAGRLEFFSFYVIFSKFLWQQ
ncbi:MAG: potassium transporter TrkG, partial [Acidobacteriota bacterium]